MKPKKTIAIILLATITFFSFNCTLAMPQAEDEMIIEIPDIMTPLASGISTEEISYVIIDYSHTYYGYIMAKHIECASVDIKILITKPNGAKHIYSLHPENGFDAFPLTGGDGTYIIQILKHIEGMQYMEMFSSSFDAVLTSEFMPFLHPNQAVQFTRHCAVVRKATELTAGIDNIPDKISAIGNFIVSNVTYDDSLIDTREHGYIPDVNNILEAGSGLCLDFSALMVAMLRSQIIPAKLVVGSADEIYHAWVEAHDGEKWIILDLTISGNPLSQRRINEMNYTIEFVY